MKIYIRTFGCQMNERDSEWVSGILLDKGYTLAASEKEADVIIFNTCSVRKHAEDRAISNMGSLVKLKEKRPDLIFGIMGCTAEYHGKKLLHRLPHVDFICGTGNLEAIPELIESAAKSGKKEVSIGRLSKHPPEIDPVYRSGEDKAYVSISRGCTNFCTYCIVPYVRGPERSRKESDIIEEVKGLLDRGYCNITLLGQNVNAYGKDLKSGHNFIGLLEKIDALEGAKRISFMTSHPKDISTDTFRAIAGLDGVSKELHLPVQSGSDKILKAMNRGYDSKYYKDTVEAFRSIVPAGGITTDFITGFPGESEADHEDTKAMMKEIGFNAAFLFKYSPRPPAPSSEMEDDVPEAVKAGRHKELLDIQRAISKKKGIRRDV